MPVRPRSRTGGTIAGTRFVTFDVVESEEITDPATKTKFPIETGGTISDHVTRPPVSVNIQGIFTDTPTTTPGAEADMDRSQQFWRDLLFMQAGSELVLYMTPVRFYFFMLILDVKVSRGTDRGRSCLYISVMLEQAQFATFESVTISADQIAEEDLPHGSGEEDLGTQEAANGEAGFEIGPDNSILWDTYQDESEEAFPEEAARVAVDDEEAGGTVGTFVGETPNPNNPPAPEDDLPEGPFEGDLEGETE